MNVRAPSVLLMYNVFKQSARRITELAVDKFIGFRLLQVTCKLLVHSGMFGQWVMLVAVDRPSSRN